MKRYNKAFTLVELIVGITISMILMFSVSIFVSNGIKNITSQKIIIENDAKTKQFTKSLYEILNIADKNFTSYNFWTTWILLKVNKNFDKWGFVFIWSGSFDKLYCSSWSDSEITSHIYLKTFIPFEWLGWDIFSLKSYNNWTVSTNMFSWTINSNKNLVWPTDLIDNWWIWFVSDTLWHSIYKFNYTALTNFTKITWKEVFWNEFSDWDSWTWIFLNNPTWLSYAIIWSTGYLFISDTLNDRILYQNLSNNKIYKLLWREDWLKEPTGIYYVDAEKTLYIANSGKKQILSYSSSWSFVDNVNINFTPKNDIKDINNLVFSFHYGSWSSIPDITWPSSTWSISFTNILAWEDAIKITTNSLTYHLIDFTNPPISELLCWVWYLFSWPNPIKCTQTNSWIIWSYRYQTFTWWENYNIIINNITGPDFWNSGSYYIWLNLLSWSTVKKSYYFHYFSKTDNDIFTKSDNILRILTWWLGYPTGLFANWSNLVFNDFLQRKKIEITKTWSYVTSTNLSAYDFSKIKNNILDTVLNNPVENYSINIVDNLVNVYVNYYKNYSCYNLDENAWKTKELILKKSLK